MNCPTCAEVFKNHFFTYKHLPVRFTEFGIVHRNEPSGSMHGLFRSKSFTQDDGHIFCTLDQVSDEVSKILNQSFEIYKELGFLDINVKLALRPDERIGTDADWNKAEKALIDSLEQNNIMFETAHKEGAFYGPKIEFHLQDSLGRSWQCGTIQIDLFMPARLDVSFIDETGHRIHPVMLHRAILGSMERAIGMLLEHHHGKLPVWLAPVQIVLLNITQDQVMYAQQQAEILMRAGVRVEVDLTNTTLGSKLRYYIMQKVPYIAVVGHREENQNNLSIRQSDGVNTVMTVAEVIKLCI